MGIEADTVARWASTDADPAEIHRLEEAISGLLPALEEFLAFDGPDRAVADRERSAPGAVEVVQARRSAWGRHIRNVLVDRGLPAPAATRMEPVCLMLLAEELVRQ